MITSVMNFVSNFDRVLVTCKDGNTGGSTDMYYPGRHFHGIDTANDNPVNEVDCFCFVSLAVLMQCVHCRSLI
jgi:hypothetical protein